MIQEAYRRADVSPGDVNTSNCMEREPSWATRSKPKPWGPCWPRDVRRSRCLVGSVKTNLGHLEAAAGIAGLIKVALAIKHGQIPPSLQFERPNPYIPFDKLPLRVQQRLTAWPEEAGRPLAGVSSFGFGGTNAPVVVAAPRVLAASENGNPSGQPTCCRSRQGQANPSPTY